MSDFDSPPAPFHREQAKQTNTDEAEEDSRDKTISFLARKLEQLRADKIQLQNAPKAESNAHVKRLGRPRGRRFAQQNKKPNRKGRVAVDSGSTGDPSTEVMLENINLRHENEQLRKKLADLEQDFIRISRLNDNYREELIDHKNRLGLPISDLFVLSSSTDLYSQPTSPHFNAVPIPPSLARGSRHRRPYNNISEENSTHSSASGSFGLMLGPEQRYTLSSFPSRLEAQMKNDMGLPNVSARSSGPTVDSLQIPSN
ncbi:hypothetical protein GYMLUDRAFT_97037 [Collybiopsis luxurians FD-317 M1]|uniref:Uncharacterized protein n=1 Tax=Collybiopsis luxurians FD-317 M1 TaxID=944289 RepID=A0A0D0CE09_9AGAR|nr:hypothetical protein GYMLUDRAFT_97037 [Collybiopsis luxurians FD-317 M1]